MANYTVINVLLYLAYCTLENVADEVNLLGGQSGIHREGNFVIGHIFCLRQDGTKFLVR